MTKHDDIIVLKGKYDKVQNVLDAAGIPFLLVNSLDEVSLVPTQLLIINCPGSEVTDDQIKKIRAFVRYGGSLITTDWALHYILEKAFPEFVAWNTKRTRNETVAIEITTPSHPLVSGFKGDRWWLETESYPIKIIDDDRVSILINSPELRERYEQSAVAVYFRYWYGEVFHMISHFCLQRTSLEKALQTDDKTTENIPPPTETFEVLSDKIEKQLKDLLLRITNRKRLKEIVVKPKKGRNLSFRDNSMLAASIAIIIFVSIAFVIIALFALLLPGWVSVTIGLIIISLLVYSLGIHEITTSYIRRYFPKIKLFKKLAAVPAGPSDDLEKMLGDLEKMLPELKALPDDKNFENLVSINHKMVQTIDSGRNAILRQRRIIAVLIIGVILGLLACYLSRKTAEEIREVLQWIIQLGACNLFFFAVFYFAGKYLFKLKKLDFKSNLIKGSALCLIFGLASVLTQLLLPSLLGESILSGPIIAIQLAGLIVVDVTLMFQETLAQIWWKAVNTGSRRIPSYK